MLRVEMVMQPNQWSCMPAAFAMATRTSITDILEHVGHDGSEIVFPEKREPLNRRGFHLQEMVDYVLANGDMPIVIEACPVMHEDTSRLWWPEEKYVERFRLYLGSASGVLLGLKDDHPHAVYWYAPHGVCYDPTGITYKVSEFSPMMLVMIL